MIPKRNAIYVNARNAVDVLSPSRQMSAYRRYRIVTEIRLMWRSVLESGMKSATMEEIWIIGLGQFGSIAFQRLSQCAKERRFVLVDAVEEKLHRHRGLNTALKKSDGVVFLDKQLRKGRKPDWIIPAVPVHLAAEWMLLHLGTDRLKRKPLPAILETLVPNPMHGSDGNLYVSHADFRCPDDCEEPHDICTITRGKRKQNMYELLGELDIKPFKALTIQSRQLGPGIGGYRPEQLIELRQNVEQSQGTILVSTACRCHGVITGLEKL